MLAGIKKTLLRTSKFPDVVCDRLTSKWVVVVGDSMLPTLQNGQRVRVSRQVLRKNLPARGDIAFFEHPHRDGFWEVKRVVGLPGESVEFEFGRLVVDGTSIEEPYLTFGDPRLSGKWQLEPEEYLVLGDNRRRSTDSRHFGPIERQRILGLVVQSPD